MSIFNPVGLEIGSVLSTFQHHFNRLFFTTFTGPTLHASHVNRTIQLAPKIRLPSRSTPAEEQTALYHYFTMDGDLTYLSFFEDWGPLNIAMVYRACIYIHELLEVHPFTGRHPLYLTYPAI